MLKGLRFKIGSVLIILVIAAVAELLNTIILGRSLDPIMFGRFKFMNTIIIMLSSLLLFGQNMALMRILGRNNLNRYNWNKFIIYWLKVTAIFAAIACVSVGFYYKLNAEMFFVYFAVLSAVGIEYYSALLRANEKYVYSVILSKSTSMVFFLVLIFILCLLKMFSFFGLLFIYTSIFIVIFITANIVLKKSPCGKEDMPQRTVKDGLWLFLIAFSLIIMTQIDQFFITKMLGYEKLAHYVVIITLTRGFDLVSMALWFVLMPHYAKNYPRSIKNDSLKVMAVALIICIIYIIFGSLLLHIFFGGRYDDSIYLIKFFVLIGFLKIAYTIPSGIIGGRLPETHLKSFLVACVIVTIVNLIGNSLLIPSLGLMGAAISALVSWVLRVVLSYFVIFRKGIYVQPRAIKYEY